MEAVLSEAQKLNTPDLLRLIREISSTISERLVSSPALESSLSTSPVPSKQSQNPNAISVLTHAIQMLTITVTANEGPAIDRYPYIYRNSRECKQFALRIDDESFAKVAEVCNSAIIKRAHNKVILVNSDTSPPEGKVTLTIEFYKGNYILCHRN